MKKLYVIYLRIVNYYNNNNNNNYYYYCYYYYDIITGFDMYC